MFYRPDKKSVCADVIPFYENGEYKLFYLKDYRDLDQVGEGCDWNLVTTKDFVNYEEHGVVLPRGSKEEQDLYVYTGCCYKHQGKYYIFYTGHNPYFLEKGKSAEVILLATSDDLLHWKKEKDFVFEGPDWLEKTDFRDAFVFFDEEKNKFAMLLASRKKQNGPVSSKGVTVVAYSDDLYHWEVSKDIFFDPESYYTHECPDLFKMGDYYYLIFSEFTDRYQTTYRMSKSIHGPWVTPRVNTFDGHAFYAAKTASDGVKRYIFGWNPIKDKEQDEGIWQWGGNIIVHELVQDSDGLLYVKCPESVRNAYPTSCEILATRLIGTMKQVDDSLVLGNSYGRTIVSYGALPNVSKIEFDFEIFNDTGDFGIILNESRSVDNYYTVRFEPLFQRVAFDRWPRKERTQHTLTDVERYLPLTKGVKNHVTLLIQDSVLEVYVNDRVAMSTRMFDFRGNWGLYTQSTVVKFSSIRCNKE